jgi:hypothetical protein
MHSLVVETLKHGADRGGFTRERFEEKRIPSDHSNVVVMTLFPDYRGLFVASSLLLNRYRVENKGSKYFVLCSWPGFQGLFPYVDEYWSPNDLNKTKTFFEESDGLKNKSNTKTVYLRHLNEFYREVVDDRELLPFYEYGFKQEFFEQYKTPQRFLPFVPSATVIGKEFTKSLATFSGYKVFIHPMMFAKQWNGGKTRNIRAKKEFWIKLVDTLLKNGFTPVIWQNYFTYDISQEFTDSCIFLGDKDVTRALAAMRATGCVLDVFGGVSRFAIAARCPFIMVDERTRYYNLKEHEIDDLCGTRLPKDYIFTFSTIISAGSVKSWERDIFLSILRKLEMFLPKLNRDEWPSTAESTEVVPYQEYVRKIKKKKFGTRFIRVPKE